MEKNFNNKAVSHFEELEERLEMAQVASSDVARCGGTNSGTKEDVGAEDFEVQP